MATKRNQPQYLSQRQQFNFDAGEDFINSLPDNSNQKKKEEPGNFARGFKKSMYQIPQTIGGTIGLAGDVLGADGMRDYGMGIYENNTKKVEELTRDSDSISNVMEGNGSFGDWLSSGAGYVGGQALSALATGGVGALVGKQLASRGVRHMLESQLEKEAAKQAISKGAKVGAASAAFGSNLVQEAGSIYPEALQEAQKNGVELTAGDKARIIGSSLAAAGVDTLGEALIANKFLGGGRRAITNSAGEQVSESVGRAALREVPLGMAKEAGTEGVQTAIERYGANQDLSSKEAIRDYVDSAALGALGGAGGGVASSFTKQRILETGPLTRSLNAGIDVENATLQTSPQNPATQNIDPQNPAPQPSANLPATQNNPAQQFTGMDELISAVQNEDNPSLVREITQRQAQQQMDQPSQIEGGPTNFDELLQQSNQQREQERIETRESWEGAKEQAAIDLAEQDRLEQENRLRLPAPDMPMPEGALIDDNGTLRPQTYQDAAAAQVAAAQREELGQPVPYGERGGIENVSVPSSPSVPEEPAYILHPSGKPFTNKIGAQSRLKQLGGNHTIVPYEGGFAIRNNDPQAVTQVQEQQAASGVPDATAGSAQPDPVAIQPGDIMHPSGKPFANKYPAVMTQRQSGGEIIKVDGGYIVRPPKQASLEEIVAESQSEPTYEKGKTGAETARNKLDAENPFLSFLGKYGLNIEERSDVGGERGKARLIPGHGPLFRKNGLRLDELAQVAKEAGFLSQEQIDSDTDNGGVNALSDMIGQALNNEVIPKVQSEPEVNPDVEMLNEAKNLGLETTGKTPDQVYDMIKAVHDQKYDSQQEQEWNTAVELFNDLSLEAQELAREYNLHELYFDIEELENAKTNDTGSQGQASEPVTGGAIQTEEVNRGDNETSTKQAEGVDAAEAGRKEGLEPELVQQESAKQAAEDDNGVTVRAGKGLISDKFLSEIDGDVVPGGPFETEDQARTAAIEWKNTKIRAGENDKAERERRDKLADKVKAGSQLSSDELKSIGLREGYSDMRWFIGAAADLFGISSRSIRSNVSSLIKDAYTDMGAKRELVPTNKALQAVSNSLTKTVDSISDFGEKIGGAKKDVWSGFKDKMDAAKDLDIAAEPLSKSWPEPDYQGLLDNGADSWAVGFMHAARDAVPRKPTKSYKLKSWAAGVETLRNFAAEIADGTVSTEKVKTEMRKLAGSYSPFHFDDLLNRIELYQAVGHSKSLADVRIGYGEYAMLNGVEYKPSKVIWTVEKKAAASAFSNFPRQLAQGSTKQAAIDDFKAKFSAMEITKPANKEVTFDVFSERGKPGFFVGKKVGRNFITLAGPFDTVKEARAHRNDNQDQLVTKLEKAKEIPSERRDTNNPRVGEDMREGRGVTPEMFSNAFGFRGVEFGNYVEQSKRQADLNEAYDALMDMAALLGIPPKSISLNGTLGLAFGARGSGGKQAAAAHYESNKVVINLTKKSGAGSLGHEWWHALDNYFSRMAQKPGSFMTERLDVNLSGKGSNYIYRDEGVRKEMIDAFGAVMKSIRSTAIKARSSKLDGKRTKEYWTTDVEMSARAFESYLISKLQDNNASNDYLANIVGADTWAAAEKIGFELDDSYPYPTAGEIPAIRAGFDHLFSVIESKETDQGTALLSRSNTLGETIEVDGVERPTTNSNGKPIAATEEGVKNFWRWFGDSKVVDADGKPMVVYHGTKQDFNEFSPAGEGAFGRGIYLSGIANRVKQYWGGYGDTNQAIGGNVLPVYLKIDKPSELTDVFKVKPTDKESANKYTALQQRLIKQGFDGSISWMNDKVWEAVAFSPLQIKSATGNNGDFDGTNPDIRYSKTQESGRRSKFGFDVDELQPIVDQISSTWKNAPKINIVQTIDDLPFDAPSDARGAYFKKQVYLVAANLRDQAQAEAVLLHETLGHAGLNELFGEKLAPALRSIAMKNRKIAEAAAVWRKGNTDIKGKMSDERYHLVSIEEALADYVGTGRTINGVEKLLAAIQKGLRAIGLNKIADWMENATDAEVLSMLASARKHIEKGSDFSVFGEQQAQAFSRDGDNDNSEDDRGNIEKAKRRLSKFVDEFLAGRLTDNDTQLLGDTPPVLKLLGASNHQVMIDGTRLKKILAVKHQYEITPEMVKEIPEGLFDPLMVFDSPADNGTMGKLMLTEQVARDGSPVVVVLHLNKKSGRLVVNEIASTYGFSNTVSRLMERAENLEYIRNEKSLQLFTTPKQLNLLDVVQKARSYGVNVLSDQDVVNEFGSKFSRSMTVGDNSRVRTPEQLAAFENVGRTVEVPTLKERFNKLTENLGKKLAQGIVDQFAPIKDLSAEAYGLMRLSKGASGAFEAMLKGGQLKLSDGVYDFDDTKRGGVVDRLLVPLQGEADDFMWWVAGNRAESLTAQGKEHLFTVDDIKAFKSLSDGQASFDYTIQHGLQKGKTTRDRAIIYADSLKTFNEFNKNTLDMAEQSGLIDPDSRKIWESEFYIPFYRVSEESDDGVRGMNVKSGVVRQQAFKKLKGGTDKLNSDLLENTLMNWAHLLDASAKNRAAKSTLEAAENVGAAMPAMSGDKKTVWYMDNGEKKYFSVEDVHLLAAIQGLEYAGMRSPIMNAMSTMKHAMTMGVTASPFFKVRNLIRDSVSAIGIAGLDYNPGKNIKEGWKLTNPKSDEYFRLLAGGGTIHFGAMLEGSEAKRIRKLVASGVDESTILNSDSAMKAFYRKHVAPAVDSYNELGNRGESINRASLYDQLIKQGKNHAEASLMARDLMDFSMQGAWTSIRFLTQVVPFMNARLQGLYKLGKSAKEDPKRFGTVLGAVAMSSIALMLAYSDDDDWKKREDFDRDNFWWFKVGDTAFRIPKPFEIGAIGTLAERGVEYFTQDEMTGERFMSRFKHLMLDSLSMNPIPQMIKPVIDVYANKDSFTGRPIETMSMERLRSDFRFNGSTSMAARGLSTAGNSVTGDNFLSPVQIDHLIRGYFGWLGSFVVGSADRIVRPFSGEPEKATPDYAKWLSGGMVADTKTASSRYVSQMYEQAKVLDEAYGTWRMLIKTGKLEEAKEFAEDNADKLRRYKGLQNVKKQATSLNEQVRVIERSNLDADEKREKINLIQQRKDNIARRASL